MVIKWLNGRQWSSSALNFTHLWSPMLPITCLHLLCTPVRTHSCPLVGTYWFKSALWCWCSTPRVDNPRFQVNFLLYCFWWLRWCCTTFLSSLSSKPHFWSPWFCSSMGLLCGCLSKWDILAKPERFGIKVSDAPAWHWLVGFPYSIFMPNPFYLPFGGIP